MSKKRNPVTPAIRILRASSVQFSEHPYKYEAGGGTALFAREAQTDEHLVIKTLVMENEHAQPMIVLMFGDREVSTRELARQTGNKTTTNCDPATAQRHTGYKVGGTSPFGTRKKMPVYCEKGILSLPLIYINGGARGYIVSLDPREMARLLRPTLVDVGR